MHGSELIIGIENDAYPVLLPADDDSVGADPGVAAGELFQALHGEDETQLFQIGDTDIKLDGDFGSKGKFMACSQKSPSRADIGCHRVDHGRLIFTVPVGYFGLKVETEALLFSLFSGHGFSLTQ